MSKRKTKNEDQNGQRGKQNCPRNASNRDHFQERVIYKCRERVTAATGFRNTKVQWPWGGHLSWTIREGPGSSANVMIAHSVHWKSSCGLETLLWVLLLSTLILCTETFENVMSMAKQTWRLANETDIAHILFWKERSACNTAQSPGTRVHTPRRPRAVPRWPE